jgi:hypothetical protein
MARGVAPYLVAPLVALSLVGCRFYGSYEARDPWRAEAEERCLAEGQVKASAFVEPATDGNGSGLCGMNHPFKLMALNRGEVAVQPKATLACPLISGVDRWIAESVQPAAYDWFGEPVVEVKQISAYACRPMNNQHGATISEHAFGNAIDVATFRLASGREVTVEQGWRGQREERGFLRQVHAAACERFSTVLGPGADPFHYNHLHLDLARRASGRSVCKPEPQEVPMQPRDRQGIPMVRRGPPQEPAVAVREPSPRATVAMRQSEDELSARTARALGERNRQPPGEPLSLAPPPRDYARPPVDGGLRPPAAIPSATRRGDPYVTGSIKKKESAKLAPRAKPAPDDAGDD